MENDTEQKVKGKIHIFVGGIILGMLICAILIPTTPGGKRMVEARELVNQCEINLPRSQTCAIIAIPKDLGEVK